MSAEDLSQRQEREDKSCALGTLGVPPVPGVPPDSRSLAENSLPCLVSQILTCSLRSLSDFLEAQIWSHYSDPVKPAMAGQGLKTKHSLVHKAAAWLILSSLRRPCRSHPA